MSVAMYPFEQYPVLQRRVIYAMQRQHRGVRVTPRPDRSILVEGLDGSRAQRTVDAVIVDIDGRLQWRGDKP